MNINLYLESQEFQRAYMDRRANELSKVIDDHDKQLDIILHAIETYRNSPKELKAEVSPIHLELTAFANYFFSMIFC